MRCAELLPGEGRHHCSGSFIKMLTKEGVDSVHTLGFVFGCISMGLGRIGEVFERGADFRGNGWFESHLAHVFSRLGGLLASKGGQMFIYYWPLRGPFCWLVLWPGGSFLRLVGNRFLLSHGRAP